MKVAKRCWAFASIGLIALTVGALATPAPQARAQTPGENGLIAYLRDNVVYTARSDGTDTRAVFGAAATSTITWSPDGNRLAFVSNPSSYELWIVNADGASAHRILNGPTDIQQIKWSPDGSRIAFRSGASIATVAIDGSGFHAVTTSNCDDSPNWSPDSTLIVFGHNCYPDVAGNGLYTVAADGSAPPVRLTTGADILPDYSPDGATIVFVRDAGRASSQIQLVDADGGNLRTVPRPSTHVDPAATSFSPDGARLLYTAATQIVEGEGNNYRHVFTIAPDGASVTQVDPDARQYDEDGNAEWQPVGPATLPRGPAPAPGSISAAMIGGGLYSTGREATPSAPVQVAIQAPDVNGNLTVGTRAVSTTPPGGFAIFGTELVIDAPPAAAGQFYQVDFKIDGSTTGEVDPRTIQVFRNGSVVADCVEPLTLDPDPCVSARDQAGEDPTDTVVHVLTSHFSTWNFGKRLEALNQPPTADNVSVSTPKNTKVAVDLVANDPENAPLTYTVGKPTNGKVTGTAPKLTYTPNAGFTGSDSFTYTVSDGPNTSATATVTITVAQANRPPVAHSALVVTKVRKPAAITLRGTDADGDTLTYARTSAAHGTVTGTGKSVTYTPAPGFSGLDAFTYTVNDGKVTSAKGTIVILVLPNHRPIASPQSVTVTGKTTITLSGVDIDGDALTYAVGTPAHGTAVASGRQVVYTPTKNYTGSDAFTFTVSDGSLTSTPAKVSITVRKG